MNRLLAFSLFILLMGTGCNSCNKNRGGGAGSVAQPLPPVNFTGKSEPVYAQNFRFIPHDSEGYRELRVADSWKGADTMVYILYPKGTVKPNVGDKAYYIETPVTRVICLSTTHIAMMSFIDCEKSVIGATNAEYINNLYLRMQIDSGKTTDLGNGMNLNYEKLMALKPDLVLTNAMGNSGDVHEKLHRMGVPVLVTAEYNESSPLGQAEWVRCLAALTGQEVKAEKKYLEMAADYESLQKMQPSTPKPRVFVGSPQKGTWYVPGGKSYVAQMIKDAGAEYVFSDDESRGGVVKSFEEVLSRARDADVWINVGFSTSQKELLGVDSRLSAFRAFTDNDIFNYHNRVSKGGGFDIFEAGVVYPNKVLLDYIKMFHPDKMADRDLYFYKRLEPTTVY